MRYGNLNLGQLIAIVDAIGEDAAKLIAAKELGKDTFVHPKYGPISLGRLEALLNIIFRDISLDRLPDILAGRLVPQWIEKVRLVVDSTFRCTPDGLENHVTPPNTQFRRLAPTAYDTMIIMERLARLKEFWPFKSVQFPSADEVKTHYQAIMDWVKRSEHEENGIANLALGPHYLGVMPRMEVVDLGTTVEKLVDAGGLSYEQQFRGRKFTNHRKGSLAGKVVIADGVRYGQFVQKVSEGAVVWVSFPCLQGFSILAQREQEARMPDRFTLGGALDGATELMLYPDHIAVDYNTVGRDCSANTWQGSSLCFKAYDDRLGFSDRFLVASDRYSGSLVVLG